MEGNAAEKRSKIDNVFECEKERSDGGGDWEKGVRIVGKKRKKDVRWGRIKKQEEIIMCGYRGGGQGKSRSLGGKGGSEKADYYLDPADRAGGGGGKKTVERALVLQWVKRATWVKNLLTQWSTGVAGGQDV